MATVSKTEESAGWLKRHLLLLGYQGSGNTSCCIAITGQEKLKTGQPTVEPVLYMKTFGNRLMLLVDTPGWSLDSKDAAEEKLDSQNTVLAQIKSLCYPGLHAVLLVVPIGQPFTEYHRQGMVERVEAAGMDMWKFSAVLFTGADKLWGNGVEEFIAEAGTALQRLVERCRNRYHALDNTCSDSSAEVNELLEKVEEIAQDNEGCFFSIDDRIQMFSSSLQEKEGEQRVIGEVQSPMFRSPPRELRMLLVGWQGSGKSSAGNMILGGHKFVTGRRTEVSLRCQAHVNGRRVTIVDTPGWDWFSARHTPQHIIKEIRRGAGLLHPGPHALLLVIPVISTLTSRKRRALENHLDMLGKDTSLHTMVLFSCGDWLGCTPVEEQIQKDGGHLLILMERCLNYYHVMDSTNMKTGQEQVIELLLKIEEMVAQNKKHPFLPVECKSSENKNSEDKWQKMVGALFN